MKKRGYLDSKAPRTIHEMEAWNQWFQENITTGAENPVWTSGDRDKDPHQKGLKSRGKNATLFQFMHGLRGNFFILKF